MSAKLDQLFKALADPNRRKLLRTLVLSSTALNLTNLAEQFDLTRQAVTKHVRVLEHAGLIEATKSGREIHFRSRSEQLQAIQDWLTFYEAHWDQKLNDLGTYLDEQNKDKSSKT